ncbi:DNA helicase, partial [Tanacetum coccineum]
FFSDYIGCLRSTGSISDFGDPNRRQGVRRNIKIENLNGNIVECTLWDEMANHFGEADIHSMEQPVIIAISSCRVSKYTGTPSLASAAINQSTEEEQNTQKDKEKCTAGEGVTPPPSQSTVTGAAKNNEESDRPRGTSAKRALFDQQSSKSKKHKED